MWKQALVWARGVVSVLCANSTSQLAPPGSVDDAGMAADPAVNEDIAHDGTQLPVPRNFLNILSVFLAVPMPRYTASSAVPLLDYG